jgi:hypothetical protein
MSDVSLPTSLPTRKPTKPPTRRRYPRWHNEVAPADLAVPVKKYLRTFQKLLKARATDWQRRLMAAAATSAARYDAALHRSVTGSTLAHYERVQRMAYASMLASFPKRNSQPAKPLLADVLSIRGER